MADPENMTLVLLRELRATMDAHQEENRARFDRLEKRLEAMHLNGTKALKGFIGHRAMVERTVASFDDQVTRLEERVAVLEASRS